MSLNRNLTAAVSHAVTDVMNAYSVERAGRDLPPLAWSLVTGTGYLTGCASDHAEDQVLDVLTRWARALGLTQVSTSPNMAGSVTYTGEVEGRDVVIWGVTDRDTWEQPATQPPGGAS